MYSTVLDEPLEAGACEIEAMVPVKVAVASPSRVSWAL